MAGPAATIGSMHTCPMVTGTVPPVGGPVIGPGVPTVLIGGKPAAVMGDTVTCAGPPDTIVQGESTVLIGGKPAATVGSMTAHGGVITTGEPTVLIGTGGSGASATMSVKRIPFPKITFKSKVLASVVGKGKSLAQAQENQEVIRQEAEDQQEIKVSNLQWEKDGNAVDNAMVGETVVVTADVEGVEDEKYISVLIYEKDEQGDDDFIDSILAQVLSNKIDKEWTVKYVKDDDDTESAAEMQQKNYTMPEFVFKYDNSDGENVESNVLTVEDCLVINAINDETEEPLAGYDYTICLPNGDFITGTLDDSGYAKIESLSSQIDYPVVFSKDDKMIELIKH